MATDGRGCWGPRERERQICTKECTCVDCGFFSFASLDCSGALDVKENEALTAEIWLFVVPRLVMEEGVAVGLI